VKEYISPLLDPISATEGKHHGSEDIDLTAACGNGVQPVQHGIRRVHFMERRGECQQLPSELLEVTLGRRTHSAPPAGARHRP
jgi:hypothetical protein